jgi:hypothetical protein
MFRVGFVGFCFWLTVTFGSVAAQTDAIQLSSGDDPLQYPEVLFRQNDHHRAITEALRVQFEFQADDRRYDLNQLIYRSYLRLEAYDEADVIADYLLDNETSGTSDPIRRGIAACQVWSLTEREDEVAAEQVWKRYLQDDTIDAYPSIKMIPEVIDPEKAKRYAMILPGSGFLLSRQYGKAVVSFMLNALFIAGSYHYLSQRQFATAGLLMIFEIGWYRGGIEASAEAAIANNQQTARQYRQRWYDTNLKHLSFEECR